MWSYDLNVTLFTLLFKSRSIKGIKRLFRVKKKAIQIGIDIMSAIIGIMVTIGDKALRSVIDNVRFMFV
jgi:hypothetical protein